MKCIVNSFYNNNTNNSTDNISNLKNIPAGFNFDLNNDNELTKKEWLVQANHAFEKEYEEKQKFRLPYFPAI